MSVKPSFEGKPSGERERGGNGEIFEQRFEGGPVGERPIGGRRRGRDENGCESNIWTGTWSEPVEGKGVSHAWQK